MSPSLINNKGIMLGTILVNLRDQIDGEVHVTDQTDTNVLILGDINVPKTIETLNPESCKKISTEKMFLINVTACLFADLRILLSLNLRFQRDDIIRLFTLFTLFTSGTVQMSTEITFNR